MQVIRFEQNSGGSSLDDLTITGGVSGSGGGIFARNTFLTITGSTIEGNRAINSAGIAASGSSVYMYDSTVARNLAFSGGNGGGFGQSGGSNGKIVNSTFYGNQAEGRGGAIANFSGPLSLYNSTVSGNTASAGGGVVSTSAGNGTTFFQSSIIGKNTATTAGAGNDIAPIGTTGVVNSFTTRGHNLIGDGQFSGTTFFSPANSASDIVGTTASQVDPLLGKLTNNGGPTETLAPQAGSQAIDTGANLLNLTNDQRGTGFARQNNNRIDIGAVETETPSLVVTTAQDVVNTADGLTSLREAIAFANTTAGANTITFANGAGQAFENGALIRLTQGELVITDAVTIDGAGKVTITGDVRDNDITVRGDITDVNQTLASNAALVDGIDNDGDGQTDFADANGETLLDDNTRIFDVTSSSAATTLNGLTLTGGYTTGANQGGGAIRSSASLTVTNSTISGNRTDGRDSNGGGINSSGAVTLTNSLVSGNSTRDRFADGGGVYASGAVSLTNSTISGNSVAGADAQGGGIYNGNSPVSLTNSIITGNSAQASTTGGGGIASRSGTVSLTNSLVTGNAGSRSYNADLGYEISGFPGVNGKIFTTNYTGGNIVGPTLTQNGTVVRADVTASEIFAATVTSNSTTAGALADNGGPVQTVALKADATNPALDAGVTPPTEQTVGVDVDGDGTVETTPVSVDARGFARSVDIATVANTNGPTDLGAFELQTIAPPTGPFVVTTTNDELDFNGPDASIALMGGANDLSLREAIFLANLTSGADTITFAAGAGQAFENGGLIRLTQGEIAITNAVTIDGAGKVTITGDANDDDITVRGDITDVKQTRASTVARSDGIDNDGDGLTDAADTDGESLSDDNSRIFNVTSSSAATTLDGLTLTGGHTSGTTDRGGAISSAAALSIINSTISGNDTSGRNASGGAVFGSSTVSLTNSTLSDNSTMGEAAIGGGILASGIVTLTNATASGNATTGARAKGGAVYGIGGIVLVNSTISGNSTQGNLAYGGGLYSYGVGGGILLADSLVLGNAAVGATGDNLVSGANPPVTYRGSNIIGSTLKQGSNDVRTDVTASEVFAATVTNNGVMAGVLADNGGPVQTIALKASTTNPALDATTTVRTEQGLGVDVDGDGTVENTPISIDARGFVRSVDIATVANTPGPADLGAFELQTIAPVAGPFVVTTTNDELDFTGPDATVATMGGANDLSLREAIFLANRSSGTDTITFAAGAGQTFENGGLIRLTQGELVITDAVTINGAGKVTITGDANDDDITTSGDITDIAQTQTSNAAATDGIDNDGDGLIDGADTNGETLLDDNSRIFNVTFPLAATTLSGLTLTGGYTTSANADGGAIHSSPALSISDSTISGNGTRGAGSQGGAIRGISTVSLINSTVSDNIAASYGGGIHSAGALSLVNTTVSGNSTTGVTFGGGGGIYGGASVSLTNSTVAGNATKGSLDKGGVILADGSISLINSTVTGNTTNGTSAEGGGLFSTLYQNSQVTLNNSLVTGNIAVNASGEDLATSIALPTTYTGGNIVGATLSQNGTAVRTNVTAAEVFDTTVNNNGVQAGGLANNGGPVQTIALKASLANPAIDAGGTPPTEQALGVDVDGDNTVETTPISIDARGFARSADFAPIANTTSPTDIGAFEAQIVPTPGPDLIPGTAGNDVISLLGGNDLADLSSGQDVAFGRAGNDTLNGGAGNDTLNGGNDDDTLSGGEGANILRGQAGNDTLTAGSGNDTLSGGPGTDSVAGGQGDDSILGQGSNDILSGQGGDDSMAGGSGNDQLFGGLDNDSLYGGGNNDVLYGAGGDDLLRGAAGLDSLYGGAGNDTLFGGNARDFLDGGSGNDRLNAGSAVDFFLFGVGSDHDTIVGFGDNQDTLRLSSALFDPTTFPSGPTVQQVLDTFAVEVSGGVDFDFGGGDRIRVTSITEAQLLDDISIV